MARYTVRQTKGGTMEHHDADTFDEAYETIRRLQKEDGFRKDDTIELTGGGGYLGTLVYAVDGWEATQPIDMNAVRAIEPGAKAPNDG